MTSTCLNYYAKVDKNGFPQPSTMIGVPFNLCNCDLVQLSSTDSFVGTDTNGKIHTQIFHPHRLRYFVRTDCKNGKISIKPNSLFISTVHPGKNVAEFKRTWISN